MTVWHCDHIWRVDYILSYSFPIASIDSFLDLLINLCNQLCLQSCSHCQLALPAISATRATRVGRLRPGTSCESALTGSRSPPSSKNHSSDSGCCREGLRISSKSHGLAEVCRGDLVSLTIRQTCLIHAPSSGQTHKPSHRPCRKLCSFFLVPKSRTSTVADSLVKPWMAFELGFCKETLSSPDSVFEDFEAQA